MRPTPYVASLRIYEPISAFSPAQALRWESIPITATTGHDEQARALRRTIITEPPALKPDGAHILEWEGKRYVCPWSTAARVWAALDQFKGSIPLPVSKFFIPENIEEAININSENLEDKVPHIITETWMVPPRWFSLFQPEDRLRGQSDDGPFTVMRTSIANAKTRCAFTHDSVVSAFGHGPIEEEIADLLEWMELFHPESIVEVDYGGLAGYLEKILINEGEEGLDADTSIEDIQLSLTGLSTGDGAKAGVGYERLISRWRKVSAFEAAT
ncbi:MAG: hypothetical protein ACOYK0_04450 [Candidatus Nanopelagicaceae bacterium]